MRLFFGGLFDFKFGRGLVHLAFELITGLLEFSQTLTESAGELGKLFAPKSRITITRIKMVSGQPGIPRAIGRFI